LYLIIEIQFLPHREQISCSFRDQPVIAVWG